MLEIDIVKLVREQAKDNYELTKYGSILLTGCVCKTIGMITNALLHGILNSIIFSLTYSVDSVKLE